MHTPSRQSGKALPRTTHPGWKVLLAVPYLGLTFPQLYARATPALFGFPFFYWYQLAWVVATAVLMAIVYRKLRRAYVLPYDKTISLGHDERS